MQPMTDAACSPRVPIFSFLHLLRDEKFNICYLQFLQAQTSNTPAMVDWLASCPSLSTIGCHRVQSASLTSWVEHHPNGIFSSEESASATESAPWASHTDDVMIVADVAALHESTGRGTVGDIWRTRRLRAGCSTCSPHAGAWRGRACRPHWWEGFRAYVVAAARREGVEVNTT